MAHNKKVTQLPRPADRSARLAEGAMSWPFRMGWCLVLGFALQLGCAAHVQAPHAELAFSLEARRSEAEHLAGRGSYECLKRSYEIGREIFGLAPERTDLRDDLIRTALLLALRERQLAILGDSYIAAAQELLASCGQCQRLRVLAEIAEATPPWAGGVIGNESGEQWVERVQRTGTRVGSWVEALSGSLSQDPFVAVFHLAVLGAYPQLLGEEEAPAALAEEHPALALVSFSAALAQGEGSARAKQALSLEPTFVEAHLVLGREAMRGRKPALAEEHYREAFAALPNSVACSLGLADVLFSLHEMPQSLDLYDHVIGLAPAHREAHLRKGVILSLMDRPHEAMAALARLLDLGNWFLGEAHYWLAWNTRQIGTHDEAVRHIEESKHSLPDDPRVHALAGHLALEQQKLDRAEQSFLTVVGIAERSAGLYDGDDTLCESLSSLGRIHFGRQDWQTCARHLEEAGACHAATERIIDEQVQTIRGWSLPPPRVAVLVQRKQRLRQDTALKKAGCLFDAAVCALAAEQEERASDLARQAAVHPAFKEKAEALLEEVR